MKRLHFGDAPADMPPRYERHLDETPWGEVHSWTSTDCGGYWGWIYRDPVDILGEPAAIIRHVSMAGTPTDGVLVMPDPVTHLDRSIAYGITLRKRLHQQIMQNHQAIGRWDQYWPEWIPAQARADRNNPNLTPGDWDKRNHIIATALQTVLEHSKETP